MTDKPDIKLCYFGGSGGFIFLHLLLLSAEYACEFHTNLSIQHIIEDQWDIHDPRLWKSKEHWPDNDRTLVLKTNSKKIYFFCNPDLEDMCKFEGTTIFLYTDMRSQVFLARYKHAYFFHSSLHKNYVSYYRAQLKNWISHYENNKDSSWPRCFGPRGFQRLSNRIREELLIKPYTADCLDISRFDAVAAEALDLTGMLGEQKMNLRMNHLLSSDNFKILPDGTKVLPEVFDFFPFADHKIKLQDMINDLHILANLTGMPVNYRQEALRSHWISLHSPELLQEIGITMHDRKKEQDAA